MSTPKHFIIDVDGVLTDGQFHYSTEGKVMKIFGPNDADALLLLKPHMSIIAVSGDKRGFPITEKRIAVDMELSLHQVSTFERAKWIAERFDPKECVYMGDGIFDAMVFNEVGYAIAPANAFPPVKEHADFVTLARGGEGAVAEAVWHIMDKFFTPLDALHLSHGGGIWGK